MYDMQKYINKKITTEVYSFQEHVETCFNLEMSIWQSSLVNPNTVSLQY